MAADLGDDSSFLRDLGLRVRLFRVARGLSQDELARISGVSRVTLGSIERAEHAASVLAYRRLARALDRDIGELLAEGDVLPPRR
ncbi:MAG: helix-turn-helix transcriptional regulator [Mycobacteriales bacterium]